MWERNRAPRLPVEERSLLAKLAEPGDASNCLWKFNAHGVKVNMMRLAEEKRFLPYSQAGVTVPEGTIIGEVSFTPASISEYKPNYRSLSLLHGIEGIDSFFQLLTTTDERRHPVPEYLHGFTNIRLARFSSRFGFVSIPVGGGQREVLGETLTVWQHLEAVKAELEQRGGLDLLKHRVDKQRWRAWQLSGHDRRERMFDNSFIAGISALGLGGAAATGTLGETPLPLTAILVALGAKGTIGLACDLRKPRR